MCAAPKGAEQDAITFGPGKSPGATGGTGTDTRTATSSELSSMVLPGATHW